MVIILNVFDYFEPFFLNISFFLSDPLQKNSSLEVTSSSSPQPSLSIKKYEAEIEKLKNWIYFILVNKGVIFTSFLVLLFILYVILKRYVKKRTYNQSDIENQNNNNNNNEFNLINDIHEFRGIVHSVLNLNQ